MKYGRTTHAVWETTLECNLGCRHCGSRAGDARPHELTTDEAVDLAHQLADVGIHEVSLIGGEVYLRRDWPVLVGALRERGVTVTVVTGGLGISAATAQRIADVGISLVSVSMDGLESTHNWLRGHPGSFQAGLRTMGHLRQAGLAVGCNTQINRRSAPELPVLYEVLREAGMHAWQLQMTVPMGRAADETDLLLQPVEFLDLFPVLAEIVRQGQRDGVRVTAGNNLGFNGPFEGLLRGAPDYNGCPAGLSVLGIEADGAIKGCPSLPTAAYTAGNIREQPLRDMLSSPELTFNQAAPDLWGFCGTCRHAATCRGGCSWTAHVFFNRRGNNPYCHHRALEHARRGQREWLERVEEAPGTPFDHGRFEVRVEDLDAPWPAKAPPRFTAHQVVWPPTWGTISARAGLSGLRSCARADGTQTGP